jgi:hypothetical protein
MNRFAIINAVLASAAAMLIGGSQLSVHASASHDVIPVYDYREVLGADADADGIRDDVQYMIESKYGAYSTILRAFKKKAQIDRHVIDAILDGESLSLIAFEEKRLTTCWMRSFPTKKALDKAIHDYNGMLYNTKERQNFHMIEGYYRSRETSAHRVVAATDFCD